ncbi:methyltransferase [Streptomyces sp. NPDC051576]|uniref:methyltransferase n=1 Tax=Streptomyces sp. NPDC051576 TaxID=3155803 RepID=UPI003416233D
MTDIDTQETTAPAVSDALSTGGLYERASLATPMAIRVAATLGIADLLAEAGESSGAELSARTGTDADALERLLCHLATVGVVRPGETGGHVLTSLGRALCEDHPSGLRSRLDLTSALGRAELAFAQLLHSVRTGSAAYPKQFGKPFWDDLATDVRRSASFDEQVGVYAASSAADLAKAIDWGALGHLVDVGGGNGVTLAALLTAHPGLRGTLLDQKATVESARSALVHQDFADRVDFVAGDFFAPLPAGAGGYLLSAILHDWDDDSAVRILGRCAEAAGESGTVFVAEWIGADVAALRTELDLRMLVYYGARERGVPALTALASKAGLDVVGVHPAGALTVLELKAA